jgi:6-phosphogluconolactonase (cycloisomerase 2 family)
MVAGVLALPTGAQALKPLGALTQLAGIEGCWTLTAASEDGAATCHDARGLAGPWSVTLSPDGKSLYAGLLDGDGLAAFERGSFSGNLEQLPLRDGCITVTGAAPEPVPIPGGCTNGRAVDTLNEGTNIAVSPDGRFVYVAADGSDAVAIFSRDPSHGKLTQLAGTSGCVSETGASEDGPGTCADGRYLTDSAALALSPDGSTLYVVQDSGGFSIFGRDASAGTLTQLAGAQGCVSPDGSSADGPGTCTNGKGVNDGNEIAIPADGTSVYAIGYSDNAVAAFRRDPATGAVTQLAGTAGCVSNDGSSDEGAATCADGRAIQGPWGIGISPDGKNVYAGVWDVNGMTAFSRNAATGELTQLAGTDGCITQDGASGDGAGTCQASRGIFQPIDVVPAPDGLNVYLGNLADPGSVVAFRRNPSSGRIAQIPGLDGCYSADGSSPDDGAGTCTDIRAGADSGPLALSPDGAFLYAPGYGDDSIVLQSRQIPAACANSTATTRSNKAVNVPLTCVDLNGDPITRSIATQPANGTLGAIDQALGIVQYTPKKDFNGTDTFTYTATDGGELPSNAATATITVRDTLAASCRVRSKRVSLDKLEDNKLRLRLRCNEAARVTAELLAARRPAGVLGLLTKVKRVRIGGGSKKSSKAGTFRLRVKVNRRARRALKELSLPEARRLKPALRFKARDDAGNVSKRKTTKLKLKP